MGVARVYADVAATLVIDEADADLAPAVEAVGMRCVVAPTIMSSPGGGRRPRPRRARRGRSMSRLEIFGLDGIGEIGVGDDLAGIIVGRDADRTRR